MRFKRDDASCIPGITRRCFVKSAGAVTALTAAGLSAATASADELPRVSEDSDMAQALNYVHDAKTVAAAKRPSDRFCSNCALFTGDADSEWAACSLFPGKAVAAAGWCSAWSPKQ